MCSVPMFGRDAPMMCVPLATARKAATRGTCILACGHDAAMAGLFHFLDNCVSVERPGFIGGPPVTLPAGDVLDLK